ncbi:histidine phosphatase family protein [Naumannella cuiyingiana]|uniref:Broad specificity phosphatase PhoE n=1 Tax=Naumannella cuiyingiana TaxID=1347891 RepID=A0A7Z0IKI2_9ACTN|nr:histidine phosphatase family protein [Naumannella cuiyingiana]NYI70477.1 broad specificity phosphatase PhoE [Naumannella cuiyingiana]
MPTGATRDTTPGRRIHLVRHGESVANVDPTVYERVPDYRIPLTERGHDQARAAGRGLRAALADRPVRVYVSPYLRAHQTLLALGLDRPESIIEEPWLREQDWANYQDPAEIAAQKERRNRYGHFFYRFRDGESGADVYDRVAGFIGGLEVTFADPGTPGDIVLVTHGLTMRLFCMRWFGWTVEYFESLKNPDNAERKTITQTARGWELDRSFHQWKAADPQTTIAQRYAAE